MTTAQLALLFAVMLALAAVPGASVLAVAGRAAAGGLAHGAWASLGIAAGDALFILVAVLGLAAMAALAASVLPLVQAAAAAYLAWLGFLHLQRHGRAEAAAAPGPTRAGSFLAGLMITLGDQKAILFYLAFLPAFADLTQLGPVDVAMLIASATAAIFLAKLAYAVAAVRAGAVLAKGRALDRAAGALMLCVAAWLALKATGLV